MTRHHHIDAAWSKPNVFGNKSRTLELDAAAMERFDYFVAQLQKRGIYQYFDMLVHRKVTRKTACPRRTNWRLASRSRVSSSSAADRAAGEVRRSSSWGTRTLTQDELRQEPRRRVGRGDQRGQLAVVAQGR
ncbi:MAG: hypothetical protein QM756_47290 [Polyangiaceae bacterium]